MSEYLLTEENKRYVVFPIQNDKVYEMYKKAVASFWTPEEIDLEKDLTDFNKLDDDERYFIENEYEPMLICSITQKTSGVCTFVCTKPKAFIATARYLTGL